MASMPYPLFFGKRNIFLRSIAKRVRLGYMQGYDMNIPKHPTLIRKMRDARIKKLAPRCVPLAASLGRQVSGGWHITRTQAGKTRTVYVPKDLKEEVEASIREHKRIKKLLQEITLLQMALIRRHKTEQARRGGRGLSTPRWPTWTAPRWT